MSGVVSVRLWDGAVSKSKRRPGRQRRRHSAEILMTVNDWGQESNSKPFEIISTSAPSWEKTFS